MRTKAEDQHILGIPQKDGFYEVSFLASSPEVQLKSISGMPDVQFDPDRQQLTTEYPILASDIIFYKAEEGLWMVFGTSKYKENVHYKRLQDPNDTSEYYLLSLELIDMSESNRPVIINGHPYTNATWVLFKPKANKEGYHFKGSRERSLAIFFKKEWFDQLIQKNKKLHSAAILEFFSSEARFLYWPEDFAFAHAFHRNMKTVLEESITSRSNGMLACAEQCMYEFIERFEHESKNLTLFDVPDHARNRTLAAGRIIKSRIYGPFLNLEDLAQEVSLSAAQLKADFKAVYGTSPFQYARQLKLDRAAEMLEQSDEKIRDIAAKVGYEDASKFSRAFKSLFGVLPLKYRKEHRK